MGTNHLALAAVFFFWDRMIFIVGMEVMGAQRKHPRFVSDLAVECHLKNRNEKFEWALFFELLYFTRTTLLKLSGTFFRGEKDSLSHFAPPNPTRKKQHLGIFLAGSSAVSRVAATHLKP